MDTDRGEDVGTGQGNGSGPSESDTPAVSRAAQSSHEKRAREPGEVAHRYTDAEKKRALAEVALAGGNVRRAATALKKQGTLIPRRTIQAWKTNEPELYAEVMQDVLPQVNAGIADELTEGIRLELDAHRKGAKRLGKEIGDPDKIAPRELSKAVRDTAVSGAVLMDKHQLLTGQPTERRAHDPNELESIVRRLNEIAPQLFRDPAPVVDAEVVEPTGLPSGDEPPA